VIVHDVTFSMSMIPSVQAATGWSLRRNQYSYALSGLKQLTQAPLTNDMSESYAGVVAEYLAVYRYILGSDNQWHLLAYELNYGPDAMKAWHVQLPGPVDTLTDPSIPFIPLPSS